MDERRFDRVWDAIEADAQSAQNMKQRSALMVALKRQTEGLSAEQAARAMGVDEQQVRALRSGKIGQFELQALQAMARRWA